MRQGYPLGLGHAVLQGRAVVGDNPFVVLLPDVVLDPFTTDFRADNLAYMMTRFAQTGRSQILVEPVADSQVHKYGIARLKDRQSVQNRMLITHLMYWVLSEKPSLDLAPSNLAVVGRYVFSPEILSIWQNQAKRRR